MAQGKTLGELSTELQRISEVKKDFLVPVGAMSIQSNGTSRMAFAGHEYDINSIAHQQLAEYTGVPKPFYDKLRENTHDLIVPIGDGEIPLFDVVLNRLIAAKPTEERRLVRTLDGSARAFLSNTFNPDLDNYDVFRVAAVAMQQSGLGAEDVVSCDVTERKLYIKVVSPRLTATVLPENIRDGHGYLKEPQVVQAGFIITNSEVGLGSLSIQQTVYKLMCTNMWIKEEAYRQRHVGKAIESDTDNEVYRSDTRQADATARLLKVRDNIAAALDEHKFRGLISLMQESTQAKLEGGIEKVVDVTSKKYGLSVTERDDVLRNLIEGADLSLWGLTNAVTAAAHTAESYDRATELQAIGGRMLSLPVAEVKSIINQK